MIDTLQYIKINIRGEISIIVAQAHSGRKRYMHINVHTLTHIYMREGGDEREHIHISGDSSPICKRHLESIINYFFPNRLVETSGD